MANTKLNLLLLGIDSLWADHMSLQTNTGTAPNTGRGRDWSCLQPPAQTPACRHYRTGFLPNVEMGVVIGGRVEGSILMLHRLP